MASWVNQIITIYTEDKDRLQTIKNHLKTKDSNEELLHFDLNNLVKMPKELKGINCMKTNVKGRLIDIYYKDKDAKPFMDWEQMIKGQNQRLNTDDMIKRLKEIQIDEVTIKRYKREFGSAYWYDWCNENWGTKWNAWATNVKEEDIISTSQAPSLFMLIYEIETAWSPPFGCMPNFFKFIEEHDCTAKWVCNPDKYIQDFTDNEEEDVSGLIVRSYNEAAAVKQEFLAKHKAMMDTFN